MKVVEMFYTPDEVALLLRLHVKTIQEKVKAGEFGGQVVNLGSDIRPDYRVPASGLNEFLESRRVFTEFGVAARTAGELRRKVTA